MRVLVVLHNCDRERRAVILKESKITPIMKNGHETDWIHIELFTLRTKNA